MYGDVASSQARWRRVSGTVGADARLVRRVCGARRGKPGDRGDVRAPPRPYRATRADQVTDTRQAGSDLKTDTTRRAAPRRCSRDPGARSRLRTTTTTARGAHERSHCDSA
ncbi:uncharacterized protein LOC114240358 [Bombyx mandarina]|uniref:Uncharacterized protein LOC114240358 n=1 Tax=Bombyx mandarina TaxID=7092 RepID=A0A6J2JC44_BOMMA|nr:uncharacterized protein LOC114240358 [Bombyx mandarina]